MTYGIAEVKGKVSLLDNRLPSEDDTLHSMSTKGHKPETEQVSDTEQAINTKPASVIESKRALRSPLSKQSCVWYRHLIEEKRGSGKNVRWVRVSDDTESVLFYCQDQEGELLIDPRRADMITRHKEVKRSGSMRYSEWLLKPGDELYAIGQAEIVADVPDRLILMKGESDDVFILSNYPEKTVMLRKALKSMLAFLLAFSALFMATISYRGMSGQFSATDYLFSCVIGAGFLVGLMCVMHYNDIVFLKRRADRNWANIQVSLRKRFDLLKQLQSVLQHYQSYEKDLMVSLTAQRKRMDKALDSVGDVSTVLRSEQKLNRELSLSIEAYPELSSDKLLRQFSDTLLGLENEVMLMREGYNDSVSQYNTRIASFPDIVLAKLFKFKHTKLLSF